MCKFFFILLACLFSFAEASSCLDYLRQDLDNPHSRAILVNLFFSIEKNQMQSLFAYKNTPREKAQIVDLSRTIELAEHSNASFHVEFQSNVHDLSEYEVRVISLKKGDFVKFSSKVFRLGNFLGRGNETHVWELADNPDYAIRIPFDAGFCRYCSMGEMGAISRNLRNYRNLKIIRASSRGVEIKDTDNERYRYAIVKNVKGSLDGLSFFLEVAEEQGYLNPYELSAKDFLSLFKKGERGDRLKLLVSAMQDDGIAVQWSSRKKREINSFYDPSFELMRQYIWDEQEGRWYRVDGV
jgi:hypothetical protein